MSWTEPRSLNGYRIDCRGVGRIERTEEGVKQGIPEPLIGKCCQSEGLCWWLRPLNFSFFITLPVGNIKNFWQKKQA